MRVAPQMPPQIPRPGAATVHLTMNQAASAEEKVNLRAKVDLQFMFKNSFFQLPTKKILA